MTTSPPLPTTGSPAVALSLPAPWELVRAAGKLTLRGPGDAADLGDADAEVEAALRSALLGTAAPERAEDLLLDDPDPGTAVGRIARFRRLLAVLSPRAVRHVLAEDGELMRMVPMAEPVPHTPADLAPGATVRLSRAAVMRAENGTTAAETALRGLRVLLPDPRVVALLGTLGAPAVWDAPPDPRCGLPPATARETVRWLVACGLLAVADAGGRFAEDTGVLGQWSANDLQVHTRSRLGWDDRPYGATFRLLGTTAPQPAVRAGHHGRAVALRRPAHLRARPDEPSFSEVLEARQSIRTYGPRPMSVDQLGEFLFRTSRTRARYGPYPERGMPYEAADRPYPSGGGAHDLEVYVTAHRVEGLARSFYHYDPWRHELVEVCDARPVVDALVATAVQSKGDGAPDAVLTVTSRFSRLAWKYERIAYATTLRNVGVLYQTFYLAATVLGLAPCALGGGDAGLVARATGSDPLVEGSVGDFALGSLPTGESLAAERDRTQRSDPRWTAGQAPEWCQIRREVIAAHPVESP
ncbi:SagB family peptide dehydrogenase [Streptomyces sp. NPDC021020]|uniref:SagB family peptide dehydrogenase n=1 Tax=Streptomyces sp. NPDC021020 TaxID=3365109 RepID=UPI0037A385D5